MASGARTRKSAATPELQAAALNNVERLIFAQAVHEFGADAWQEVSKLLSQHPLVSQPKGTFTPQSCPGLHRHLMDEAGLEWSEDDIAPKSQRHLRLAQRFYVARVSELRDLIAEEETKFKKIASEIDEIRSGAWDRKILVSMGMAKESEPEDTVEADAAIPDAGPSSELPSQESAVTEEIANGKAEDIIQVQGSASSKQDGPEEKAREGDCVSSAHASPSEPEPEVLAVSEHEEKEERSDNDAVNQLIGDFGSPADAAEREETTPTPKQTSPAPSADDMQVDVDDETVKGDGDGMQHEPLPVTSPLPDVASPAESDNRDKVDEDHPDHQSGSARAEGKRKAMDEDTTILDARDKKRLREESKSADDESIDGDEGRSASMTPSVTDLQPAGGTRTRRNTRGGPNASEPPVVSKRFQNMIGMLHSQISQHRYGNIFHNPIKKSEAPDYHDIVKRPIDLKTIKARFKDGVISNSLEFQRDIFLMFANAMMYNRPGSEIYNMAEEMMVSSERDINAFRQTEGFHRM